MSKKLVYVTVPVAGSIDVEIEVDENVTEEEIYEMAIEKAGETDINTNGYYEVLEHICEGNVCYAPQWDIEIIDEEEIEE